MMLLCNEFGLVLCNIYRKVELLKIKLGRKKRKRFLEGYAKVASRFIAVNGGYAEKLKKAAEKLYRALESYDALDLIQNSDDCACAIFVLSGLRDLGKDATHVALAFRWIGFRDKIRKESAVLLSDLRKLGVKYCAMVTGDRQSVADDVASKLNIDEVRSGCLPETKVEFVENV